MDNPYRLVPGEHLTLEQFVNRYLDWQIWNNDNLQYSKGLQCDPELWNGHLCCEQHFAVSNQWYDFARYFLHLTKVSFKGFSMYSLKLLIVKNCLNVDIEKITKHFHISSEYWQAIELGDI